VDLRRIFGILYRAGKFGEAPQSLMVANADRKTQRLAMPEITYTSRLALALKAMQNKATMDTLQVASQFAATTGRTEILDNFDLDSSFRSFAINQGMGAQHLVPMRKVAQVRQARAEQVARMQQLQAAQITAKSAGDLGNAPQRLQDAVTESLVPAGA
jgi:hypothetical protein